jgi:hypothetical protein
MPARFSAFLSYQIWFYEGVQTGIEGAQPRETAELRRHHSAGIVAAYQAGLAAGRQRREEIEEGIQHVPVPDRFASSLRQKNWFLKGVEDAAGGLPPDYPLDLYPRRSLDTLKAYKAGYGVGKRLTEEGIGSAG